MQGDFWPGALSNNTYFCESFALQLWYHLRHKAPGTSERKFVEALEEISFDDNGVSQQIRFAYYNTFINFIYFILQVGVINRTLFSRCRREFEFCQHWIEKNVLHRHGNCYACGDCPLGMHADGNFKLYRFAEAKE